MSQELNQLQAEYDSKKALRDSKIEGSYWWNQHNSTMQDLNAKITILLNLDPKAKEAAEKLEKERKEKEAKEAKEAQKALDDAKDQAAQEEAARIAESLAKKGGAVVPSLDGNGLNVNGAEVKKSATVFNEKYLTPFAKKVAEHKALLDTLSTLKGQVVKCTKAVIELEEKIAAAEHPELQLNLDRLLAIQEADQANAKNADSEVEGFKATIKQAAEAKTELSAERDEAVVEKGEVQADGVATVGKIGAIRGELVADQTTIHNLLQNFFNHANAFLPERGALEAHNAVQKAASQDIAQKTEILNAKKAKYTEEIAKLKTADQVDAEFAEVAKEFLATLSNVNKFTDLEAKLNVFLAAKDAEHTQAQKDLAAANLATTVTLQNEVNTADTALKAVAAAGAYAGQGAFDAALAAFEADAKELTKVEIAKAKDAVMKAVMGAINDGATNDLLAELTLAVADKDNFAAHAEHIVEELGKFDAALLKADLA